MTQSRRQLLAASSTAAVLALAINVITAGTIRSCGPLGPFTVSDLVGQAGKKRRLRVRP